MDGVPVVASVETLTRIGKDMLGTAEEFLRNITWFASGPGTTASATPGFATGRALDDCESSWDRTLRAKGETVALHGDTLIVNANAYHTTEIANVSKFQDR